MFRTLYHQELRGGNTMQRKIIVDACEITENEYEIIAYKEGKTFMECEELESVVVPKESYVKWMFNKVLSHYLEPLQKAIFEADLIPGEKYTMFFLNDFGFPIAQKMVFHSCKYTTYAQYSDVVELIFKPYRKKSYYKKYLYNCSFAIFKGWQDYNKDRYIETVSEDANVKVTRSKYVCFDSNYIEDGIAALKNPVLIYKNYRTGVDGRIYA